MDGIFNIYKEKGFTSHDVVAIVRRTIHMKKVGHTGTLDPDAEGVLPVCVGKATKLSDVIMDGRKSYRAMLRLGVTTTTEDASGEVLETKAVVFDEGKIRAAVAAFIGRLEQVPPMYSAVKVNGKKLYELAREGKEIARRHAPLRCMIFGFAGSCRPTEWRWTLTARRGHISARFVPISARHWAAADTWRNCCGQQQAAFLWKTP